MKKDLRIFSILICLAGVVLFACQGVRGGPGAAVRTPEWSELLAAAAAQGVKAEFGDIYDISCTPRPAADFAMESENTGVLMEVKDRATARPVFQAFFAPWGSYAYRFTPDRWAYFDILTVTPQTVVFLPFPPLRQDQNGPAPLTVESFKTLLTKLTGGERGPCLPGAPTTIAPPKGVRIVSECPYYMLLIADGSVPPPADKELLALAPRKLIACFFTGVHGTIGGARIIAPERRMFDAGTKDEPARRAFAEALDRSGRPETADDRGRRDAYFGSRKTLRALFDGRGANDEATFALARDELSDWLRLPASIAGEAATETFPGYTPKRSPDTALDYRPALSAVLLGLPEAKLENLEALVGLLAEFRKGAAAHPGATEAGRLELGAEAWEFVPSDEELLWSEIGERIRLIAESTAAEDLRDYLGKHRSVPASIDYGRIEITHADVMGSGRYFYASRPVTVTVQLVK
jgi:hypothetical protein